MSHLHIPDGILPLWLWAPGLALALVALGLSARALREAPRGRIATQAALGALVLAAMAIELPLGPMDYHLSLVGPIGVLLGAAAGFEVVFVASTILAFVGHGGFTVIGLNALVLGAGAALARPLYLALSARLASAPAMALATACAQAISGALWLVVVAVALKLQPAHGAWPVSGRVALLGGIALPLFALGVAVESGVAFGVARFLARVRPDLLPGPRPLPPPSAQVQA